MKDKHKLLYLLVAIIAIIGIISMVITPIFLFISSLILKNSLPQWYLIMNIVLSGLDMIGILLVICIWLFDDNKKKDKN